MSATSPATLDMTAYLDLIAPPLEETLRYHRSGVRKIVFGLVVAFLLASVYGGTAYVLSRAMPRLAGASAVDLFSVRVPLDSASLWWVLSVGAATYLMVLMFQRDSRQDALLRPAQIRFGLTLRLVRELQAYRRDGLPHHVARARQYVKELERRVSMMFHPPGAAWRIERRSSGVGDAELRDSLFPQIFSTHRRFPSWFQLPDATLSILNAFDSFSEKISDRVTDRKDYASIEDALSDLAVYFFSRAKATDGSDDASEAYEAEGLQRLQAFGAKMAALPAYRSPEEPGLGTRLSARVQRARTVFVHPHPVVSFFAWYFLLLTLVVLVVRIVMLVVPTARIEMLLPVIVTAPLAGAVPVALALRRPAAKPEK